MGGQQRRPLRSLKDRGHAVSRGGKHWQTKAEKATRVGDQTVRFAMDATRRLGMPLDSALALGENSVAASTAAEMPRPS